MALARLRQLAFVRLGEEFRASLGSFLPEAQLEGGGNGAVDPSGDGQEPPSG